MGCWNETCGLTNLPIRYNDEVVGFLLLENSYPEIDYHCNGLYTLMSLPFTGKYNNYGCLKEIIKHYEEKKLYEEDWNPMIKTFFSSSDRK